VGRLTERAGRTARAGGSDYLTAMVVTIGLWLALAPAVGAVASRKQKDCAKPKRKEHASATDG